MFGYLFSDSSLNRLTVLMIQLKDKDAQTVSFTKSDQKSMQYLVIHGSSLESVSINAFLHFVNNFYHKKFHLTLVGMNYEKMI